MSREGRHWDRGQCRAAAEQRPHVRVLQKGETGKPAEWPKEATAAGAQPCGCSCGSGCGCGVSWELSQKSVAVVAAVSRSGRSSQENGILCSSSRTSDLCNSQSYPKRTRSLGRSHSLLGQGLGRTTPAHCRSTRVHPRPASTACAKCPPARPATASVDGSDHHALLHRRLSWLRLDTHGVTKAQRCPLPPLRLVQKARGACACSSHDEVFKGLSATDSDR